MNKDRRRRGRGGRHLIGFRRTSTRCDLAARSDRRRGFAGDGLAASFLGFFAFLLRLHLRQSFFGGSLPLGFEIGLQLPLGLFGCGDLPLQFLLPLLLLAAQLALASPPLAGRQASLQLGGASAAGAATLPVFNVSE